MNIQELEDDLEEYTQLRKTQEDQLEEEYKQHMTLLKLQNNLPLNPNKNQNPSLSQTKATAENSFDEFYV